MLPKEGDKVFIVFDPPPIEVLDGLHKLIIVYIALPRRFQT